MRRKHRVAVAVSGDISLFEVAVAAEIFGAEHPHVQVPWYDFRICRVGDDPLIADGHLTLSTPYGVDDLLAADTIVVAPTCDRSCCGELIDALREAHRRGKRIVSLCSGVFSLAAAGILDGLEVTTHWLYSDELVERHPTVRVDDGVLFIENENLYTSAGSAASIDLCLHIVRLDHGAEVANQVARSMVVPPQRDGGQAQYVDRPIDDTPGSELFTETLAWAEQHLGQPITVDELAERSAMSPRTFARRFKSATGTTPHQWLIRQRVQLAQRLLETTDLSIDHVAHEAGLGTAANLRVHFQRHVRTTPSRYRASFCCANSATVA